MCGCEEDYGETCDECEAAIVRRMFENEQQEEVNEVNKDFRDNDYREHSIGNPGRGWHGGRYHYY